MQNNHHEFSKGKEISISSKVPPVLSDYMNYRQLLADFYKFKRQTSKNSLRAYNYAVFSAAANIKSPNYLKMIIEGKRNLSDDMIGKFGKALGFNKEQTDEFRLLVHFTQATDPADRNMYLKKLSEHRVSVKIKSGEIDRKSFEKVPNWVAWIIYAMVDQEGVKFDAVTLKKALRGKASIDEIENALNIMIKSGDLRKDPVTGEIKKARSLTESPEDIPVALVRKLQAQLMYLGLESLYQDQPTEREFGTLTMSLTKSEFEEIKFKLRQMRKSINKDNSIARMKSKGERVYQLNIQLFPVSNAVNVVEKEKPNTMPVHLGQKLESMLVAMDSNTEPAYVASTSRAESVGTENVASQIIVPQTVGSEILSPEIRASQVEEKIHAPIPTETTGAALKPPVHQPQAANNLNVSPTATNNSKSPNVSSLAANAASAADLFR